MMGLYPWLAAFVLVFYVGLTYLPPALEAAGLGVVLPLLSLAVASVVLIVGLEMVLSRKGFRAAVDAIGLSRFSRSGMGLVVLYLSLLALVFPVASFLASAPPTLHSGWLETLVRVLLVNGLAEEVAMRGFVFRRLRARHAFWPAAGVATLYFAGYHLPLVFTQGVVVGTLAVVVAIPLGYLTALAYERGGNTIWAPALIHAGTNGLIMLIALPPAVQPLVSASYLLVAIGVSTAMVLAARRRTVS